MQIMDTRESEQIEYGDVVRCDGELCLVVLHEKLFVDVNDSVNSNEYVELINLRNSCIQTIFDDLEAVRNSYDVTLYVKGENTVLTFF